MITQKNTSSLIPERGQAPLPPLIHFQRTPLRSRNYSARFLVLWVGLLVRSWIYFASRQHGTRCTQNNVLSVTQLEYLRNVGIEELNAATSLSAWCGFERESNGKYWIMAQRWRRAGYTMVQEPIQSGNCLHREPHYTHPPFARNLGTARSEMNGKRGREMSVIRRRE